MEGLFDVYLLAPDDSGGQHLRWVNTFTNSVVTEITITPQGGGAIRAGDVPTPCSASRPRSSVSRAVG